MILDAYGLTRTSVQRRPSVKYAIERIERLGPKFIEAIRDGTLAPAENQRTARVTVNALYAMHAGRPFSGVPACLVPPRADFVVAAATVHPGEMGDPDKVRLDALATWPEGVFRYLTPEWQHLPEPDGLDELPWVAEPNLVSTPLRFALR